jgi:formylglycine-generating enzyme required for sulfatase activity
VYLRIGLALLLYSLLVATTGPDTHALLDSSMKQIPSGCFLMGADTGRPDEAPAHRVCIKAFLIDEYEVTNEEYKRCVKAGQCERADTVQGPWRGGPYSGPWQPVTGVTWENGRTYCEFAGKRLPTESEWEYAARGADGRQYPWGNDIDCHAANWGVHPNWEATACSANQWCDGNMACRGVNPARPADVGTYPHDASPFGVKDMGGNVAEWVEDYYGQYRRGPKRNPTAPATGGAHVVRGGSWHYNAERVRSLSRACGGYREDDVGFRCAESVIAHQQLNKAQ